MQKKFEELPENIQEALLAPETASSIYKIGKSVNLTDEKISLLAELVGNVFMSPSQNSDLTNDIKTGLGVGDDVVKDLSAKINEVVKYIQSRPMEQITDGENEEENTKQEVVAPPLESSIKPEFKEPVTTPSSPRAEATPGEIIHPAPFVLHEEKSFEGTQSSNQDLTTQRPAFYKPVFSSTEPRFGSYAKPRAAMVELGGKETRKDLPTSLKTSPQQVRIVHYSELKTEVNPFAAKPPTTPTSPTPATTQVAPLAPIHPSNVVDLKDLPLK